MDAIKLEDISFKDSVISTETPTISLGDISFTPSRANNIGNIRKDKTSFESYATPEEGVSAAAGLLRRGYRGLTLEQIGNKWAPPSENDTANWVKTVAQHSGLDPKVVPDLNDPATVSKLVTGISRIEKSKSDLARFTPDVVERGVGNHFRGGQSSHEYLAKLQSSAQVLDTGAMLNPMIKSIFHPDQQMSIPGPADAEISTRPRTPGPLDEQIVSEATGRKQMLPNLAPWQLKAVGEAGFDPKELADYLSSPTAPPSSLKDFVARVVPTSTFKTAANISPLAIAESVGKEFGGEVGKAVDTGDITRGALALPRTAMSLVAGLGDFATQGLPFREGWAEKWATDPAGTILGLLALKGAVVGGTKTADYYIAKSQVRKSLMQEFDLTKSEANNALKAVESGDINLPPEIEEKITSTAKNGKAPELTAIDHEIIEKAKAAVPLMQEAEAKRVENALRYYENQKYTAKEATKAVNEADKNYDIKLEIYKDGVVWKVRQKEVPAPIEEASSPVAASTESSPKVQEPVIPGQASELLPSELTEEELKKWLPETTVFDKKPNNKFLTPEEEQLFIKKIEDIPLPVDDRKVAGTDRESLIETAPGEFKKQGDVDLGMVEAMKKELESAKTAETSDYVQPMNKEEIIEPTGYQGPHADIISSLEEGNELRKVKTGEGWRLGSGKDKIYPEAVKINELLERGIIEYNSETKEYQLGDKMLEHVKGEASTTFPTPKSQFRSEFPKAPERWEHLEGNPAHKKAIEAARKMGEKTGEAWRPAVRGGQWVIEPIEGPSTTTLYSFPGPLGDAFREIINNMKEISLRINSNLKQFNRPDVRGPVSLAGEALIKKKFSAEMAAAAHGTWMREDILKELTEKERKELLLAHENTPGFDLKQMSSAAQRWHETIKDFAIAMEQELKALGQLRTGNPDYLFPRRVTHDSEGNPLPPTRALKGRDATLSTADLIAKGYKVELDAAIVFPLYIQDMGRRLASLYFVRGLKRTMSPTDNLPILRPESMLPADNWQTHDFKQVDFADKIRNYDSSIKYSADPALTAQMKKLKSETMWIHKDMYRSLDDIFTRPSEGFWHVAGNVQGKIKQMRMYLGFVHAQNMMGQSLFALGWESFKAIPGLLPEFMKTPEGKRTMQEKMVNSGVRLGGVIDLRSMSYRDEYQSKLDLHTFKPSDIINQPMKAITHPFRTWADMNEYLLFDTMLPHLQTLHFGLKYQKYIKSITNTYADAFSRLSEGPRKMLEGEIERKAAALAGMDTNNVLGSLPPFVFTRNQRNFLRFIMFARDWNVGTARQILGTSEAVGSATWLPKFLRADGLDKAQWKALKHENRMYVARSIAYTAVMGQMFQWITQKALDKPLTWIHQNETAHLTDIDPQEDDAYGKPMYIRNPFVRQVDDYYKMLRDLSPLGFDSDWNAQLKQPSPMGAFELGRNKMEPLLSTTLEIAPGSTQKWKAQNYSGYEILSEVAKKYVQIFPYQDIAGKDDRVQTRLERVLPFLGSSKRTGISRDPKISEIIMKYREWNGAHDRASKETIMKINNSFALAEIERRNGNREKAISIEDDAKETALRAIEGGTITKGQLEGVIKRASVPVLQALAASQKFKVYLRSIPEKSRDNILDHLDKVGGATQPLD